MLIWGFLNKGDLHLQYIKQEEEYSLFGGYFIPQHNVKPESKLFGFTRLASGLKKKIIYKNRI